MNTVNCLIQHKVIPTWYPTECFRAGPISLATRWATDTALILRGWVTRMLQSAPSPPLTLSSSRKRGMRVVFPHPVSPAITTTLEDCTAETTRWQWASTGSSRSSVGFALSHFFCRWALSCWASCFDRGLYGRPVIASVTMSSSSSSCSWLIVSSLASSSSQRSCTCTSTGYCYKNGAG